MKIHIVDKDEAHIEGYEKVEITGHTLSLDKYSDNECSFVLASDCLDLVDYEEIANVLMTIRKKMRIGSTLVIGGTDIRLLCRAVVSGNIDAATFNKMVSSKKSLSEIPSISKIVSSLGLSIITTKISGIHYEIEAKREQARN